MTAVSLFQFTGMIACPPLYDICHVKDVLWVLKKMTGKVSVMISVASVNRTILGNGHIYMGRLGSKNHLVYVSCL